MRHGRGLRGAANRSPAIKTAGSHSKMARTIMKTGGSKSDRALLYLVDLSLRRAPRLCAGCRAGLRRRQQAGGRRVDGASARRRGRRERRSIRLAWPSTRGCASLARGLPGVRRQAERVPVVGRGLVRRARRGDEPALHQRPRRPGQRRVAAPPLPAGAHAIDLLCKGDIELRPATGTRTSWPSAPRPGTPPARRDDLRREQRQRGPHQPLDLAPGTATLAGPDHRAVEFNVDGLPPVSPPEVEDLPGAGRPDRTLSAVHDPPGPAHARRTSHRLLEAA